MRWGAVLTGMSATPGSQVSGHSATLTDPNDPRTLWRITVKEPAGTFN